MKMAIFQTDLNIGGIQKSCVNFLNSIDTAKYQVDLYLVEKENIFLKDIKKNINIKYIKKLPYITKLIPFNIIKHFYDNKIDEEYDIVIDYNTYSNETAISSVKTKAKKRIMWIHDDIQIKRKEEIKYRILHFLFKSKYQYFNSFYAVSSGALDGFRNIHNLENKEYEVIPNIINTKEIDEKVKNGKKIEIDENKINVISVGRMVHQKGFDILIETINNIKNDIKDLHFYIIGDGCEYQKINHLIQKYQLNDYITLLGSIDNPYPIMNEMDGFILMSRYEGQGMVFLEAAYLGLEVILPNHLSKYVGLLEPTNDLISSIKSLKKNTNKTSYDLSSYNETIKNKINNL